MDWGYLKWISDEYVEKIGVGLANLGQLNSLKIEIWQDAKVHNLGDKALTSLATGLAPLA